MLYVGKRFLKYPPSPISFQIAAFIAEPVMGAGGVILPPKTYFEKVTLNYILL